MVTYEEAQALIQGVMPAPEARHVPLGEAQGLVLAGPVIATVDLPGYDNSAVDGYALCSPTGGEGQAPAGPIVLCVDGEASAGARYRARLRPGHAVRIFTGAAVPAGADRIVMQEDVIRQGPHVLVNRWPALGRHIRRRGEDVRRGTRVFSAGRRLGPAELALLAALGKRHVEVYRRPAVGILATGSELVPPGTRLTQGMVHESNDTLLTALVRRAGAQAVALGIVPDAPRTLIETLREALRHDLVLITGGVSVGDKDYVRQAAAACGVRTVFWQVDIKPGMPLFVGRRRNTLLFGLPGNPVSALITFEEFVLPILSRWLGRTWQDPYTSSAMLGVDLPLSTNRRTQFIRVRRTRTHPLTIEPLNGQGSHQLRTLTEADGWIRLTADRPVVPAGTQVPMRWREDPW